jgi:hypothetical protein
LKKKSKKKEPNQITVLQEKIKYFENLIKTCDLFYRGYYENEIIDLKVQIFDIKDKIDKNKTK